MRVSDEDGQKASFVNVRYFIRQQHFFCRWFWDNGLPFHSVRAAYLCTDHIWEQFVWCFYNASSSSSPLLDLRHWKAEGIKGEVYVNTTWEEVSVLFDLYGERVNFDIGNSAGRQRQFAGISSSVVYGRANIVEGSSWEFGVGLSRDARTNNSLKLSSRVGLGAGWTAYGLFTDQFSTGRTLYNSTDGYYQETKLDYSEIGVSKHLWRGIVISGSLITQNMGSDNRDAYGYDGYRAELGYYF